MSKCQVCQGKKVKRLVDFGSQPLCNRFLIRDSDQEFVHQLELGQCSSCGTIQITKPVPDIEISPRFEWLIYNEPEEHLDDLADIILQLPGIDDRSTACGVTYKDDTLLNRLTKKIKNAWRVRPLEDLAIDIPGAGGETVQARLTADAAKRLRSKYGPSDIVIARHFYEHASSTTRTLEALKTLVSENGYIIFEVPDCTVPLKWNDYTMPWEEHNIYFTPETFSSSFMYNDLELVEFRSYQYPVENALIAVTRPTNRSNQGTLEASVLEEQMKLGNNFGNGFGEYRDRVRDFLQGYKAKTGRIAVFGAGHLSCMFINLMGIGEEVDFVVDDNTNKKGLFMPGSKRLIRGSDMLVERNIKLCLLGVNPESQQKIIQNNREFIDKGGAFRSLFPMMDNYFMKA